MPPLPPSIQPSQWLTESRKEPQWLHLVDALIVAPKTLVLMLVRIVLFASFWVIVQMLQMSSHPPKIG